MTDPTPQPPVAWEPPSTDPSGRGQPLDRVIAYIEANRGRYTEEALTGAAREAGYPDDVIAEAMRQVRAREAASAPVRRTARLAVLGAYLGTYAVLVFGMFSSEYSRRYGGSAIGSVVLTFVLGIALALSLAWVRRRGRGAASETAMAVLLSLPLILLVVVAGACLATGLPFHASV